MLWGPDPPPLARLPFQVHEQASRDPSTPASGAWPPQPRGRPLSGRHCYPVPWAKPLGDCHRRQSRCRCHRLVRRRITTDIWRHSRVYRAHSARDTAGPVRVSNSDCSETRRPRQADALPAAYSFAGGTCAPSLARTSTAEVTAARLADAGDYYRRASEQLPAGHPRHDHPFQRRPSRAPAACRSQQTGTYTSRLRTPAAVVGTPSTAHITPTTWNTTHPDETGPAYGNLRNDPASKTRPE